MSRFVAGTRSIGSALTSKIHSFSIDRVQGRGSAWPTNVYSNVSRRLTVNSSFERQLLSIAVRFKADVRLRSLDDNVAATREAFGDERLDRSPGAVLVSVLTVTGSDEGGWDFGDMPSGSYSTREQRC